jgi:ABC-2 type transport system ATP-binding protein
MVEGVEQAAVPVQVRELVHAYGEHRALDRVSFQVSPGEFFGLLGPNGSGKTTLFRILSTLLAPASGQASIFGYDVAAQPDAVRSRIGIVFQSPALDDMLTVEENLRHHARLQGVPRRQRSQRVTELLTSLGLSDRRRQRVGQLSGGLKRRADLARGILHRPGLLLLDEPSAGLDPRARRDLWRTLDKLRGETGLAVMVTTHIMEEGEFCDRLAILDEGRLVAMDTPANLRAAVEGTIVTIRADKPDDLARAIGEQMKIDARVLDGAVRIEHADGHALVPRLASAFASRMAAITVQIPTLEDVFVQRTGHRFEDEQAGEPS